MKFFCEYFLNTVFVRRKGESAQLKPLDELDLHLKNGKSLILFPEGTRGLPEKMTDFKAGAALLLQRNPNVELLPVFMIGMGKAMPRGDGVLVPTECEIRIGKSRITKDDRNKSADDLTEIIKKEVLSLKDL
jgi:1-acyl-sn-glycerol-3-phosphate acyltransferase